MQIGPYGRVIIKKSESILKSSACVIPKVFLFFVLFFVLASPLISLPAAAFDIYIPGKKNFKLTDKSAQNSVTETKTWLNDDHHVVLHFTDLFGLPEAGVPESAMNEETAVNVLKKRMTRFGTKAKNLWVAQNTRALNEQLRLLKQQQGR